MQGLLSLLVAAHLHFNRCLYFSDGSPEDLICT